MAHHHFFSASKASSHWKCGLPGLSATPPNPQPYLVLDIKTYLYWLRAALNSHKSWVFWCSWGITNTTCEWGGKEQTLALGISTLLSHMLHCPTRLYFQNIISKIKLLRISRWQEQSIKPSRVLLRLGPCATAWVSCPWCWLLFQMFLK